MYVKIYSLVNYDHCDKICNSLESRNGIKPAISPSLYQCVFKGPLKCDTLAEILEYFYDYTNPLFYNSSLVDADIIVTPSGSYCLVDDRFFEVSFDESKVYRNPKMVRSVMIIPGLPAFETEFASDHETLKDILDGDYTTIDIAYDTKLVISTDYNPDYYEDFPLTSDYGVVNGPAIFVKFEGDKPVSLTDEEIQEYLARFGTPYFYTGLIFRTSDGFCCYHSTTADMPSTFIIPELGFRPFASPTPDYEDLARQSVCRGCPFMGDGCNACLHD